MAVTIDATVGGASANSFCELVEAQAFLDGKLPSPTAWDAAATDTKNRALVSATRWLCRLSWIGRRVDTTQALEWPRQDATDPDDPDGFDFDTDEVPQDVKDATAELAALMVAAGTTDLALGDSTVGIKSKQVDVLKTEYFEPFLRADGLEKYPTVHELIASLLSSTGGPSIRVERGG